MSVDITGFAVTDRGGAPRRSRTPALITGVLPVVENSLEDTM